MLPINEQQSPLPQRAALAPEEIEALVGKSPGATGAAQGTTSAAAGAAGPELASFRLEDFDRAAVASQISSSQAGRSTAWRDAELELRIELGRTRLHQSELKNLRQGTVVRLDSLEREPVDVFANDELIARGEIVVLDGKLCVRVVELMTRPAAKAG